MQGWAAMEAFTFEFFRKLYEDLDSPVLDNEDADCQFFAWDFEEFANMQQVVITSYPKLYVFCLVRRKDFRVQKTATVAPNEPGELLKSMPTEPTI